MAAPSVEVRDVGARVRHVVSAVGGVVGSPAVLGTAGPPIATPFGDAEAVEGESIRAVSVVGAPAGEPMPDPPDAAFTDGIQRFSVEGWVGVTPIVRSHVAAAVLMRTAGTLTVADYHHEDFLVTSLDAVGAGVAADLRDLGLPLYDAGANERQHPMLDLQRAVGVVEGRRIQAERAVVRRFRQQRPHDWLVVDGALRTFQPVGEDARLVAVIKSHETQFLAGADLERALTLHAGERTTVFRRIDPNGDPVHSWYLRLWDWTGQGILYGLIRVERPPLPDVGEEAHRISRWLLAERAPVAARDSRWDRLLYPVHEVENFLRAKAGAWR